MRKFWKRDGIENWNIVLLLLLMTEIATSQSSADTTVFIEKSGNRTYSTQRIKKKPPKIDGFLNDSCWSEGQWAGSYTQVIPVEGTQPSQETELKILYDNSNIYVAIRAYDNEPDKIDRQLGRRDTFKGDIVGVCFDSYHDHRTGFEFDLTAAGGKLDLVLLNDDFDTDWDAVWYGKVAHQDSSWTAEMQIPLNQLRYGNKDKHVWGLHAWRWINRNQEEDQWSLIPRDGAGMLYNFGNLEGIEGIRKNRRIEFLPYSVGKIKTYEKEAGNPFAPGHDTALNIGLDGKIGLSSDFIMDFTVNPDFGQVEADPAELNLTAFESFYQEKRPFFLEGKNILDFEMGNNVLFYSRRIGHTPAYSPDLDDNEYAEKSENTSIISAVKVTGKTRNGLSLGIVESMTAEENAGIYVNNHRSRQTVEPFTHYLVGRIQKDYFQGNTILGGMFTSTNRRIKENHLNFLPENAYTGGLDFLHHWKNKTYFLDVKTVFSQVQGSQEAISELQQASTRYYQRPDADHVELDSTRTQLLGQGGRIAIGKGANGRWRFSETVNWRSPGLELNDIGYLTQADQVSQETEVAYVVTDPVLFFRSFSLSLSQGNNWNYGGTFLNSRTYFTFVSTFQNKWRFTGSIIRNGDEFDTHLLRGGPGFRLQGHLHQRYSIGSDYSKKFGYRVSYHFHIYDDKLSSVSQPSAEMQYKITNGLILNSELDYSDIRDYFKYVTDVDFESDKRYILGQLDRRTLGLTMRLDFALSPELTIQYYGNMYVSLGKYSNLKNITIPGARNYNDLFHLYSNDELTYNRDENTFQVDENGDDIYDYEFDNPDFNYREFRSNLVLRWEYKPSSTFYLVWTQGRSDRADVTNNSIRHNTDKLFSLYSENVFLLKCNYWFTL